MLSVGDSLALGAVVGESLAGAMVDESVAVLFTGRRLGVAVGIDVEGASVTGRELGPSVGVNVGVPVGSSVGASVGDPVGNAVGASVGDPVGNAVGASVGDFVGNAVGSFVGTSVGGSVGGSVLGGSVGSSSSAAQMSSSAALLDGRAEITCSLGGDPSSKTIPVTSARKPVLRLPESVHVEQKWSGSPTSLAS